LLILIEAENWQSEIANRQCLERVQKTLDAAS